MTLNNFSLLCDPVTAVQVALTQTLNGEHVTITLITYDEENNLFTITGNNHQNTTHETLFIDQCKNPLCIHKAAQ